VKTDQSEYNVYNVIRKKINRFENISNLSNFVSLVLYIGLIALFHQVALFLDTKKDEHIFMSMYIAFALLSISIVYTFLRTLPPFSIMKHAISYSNEDDEEGGKSNYAGLVSTVMGPVLTYFSNMLIVCSTNTGMCSQVTFSTLSAILGAFGVPLTNMSKYLFPLTVFLLLISLLSLWWKRKDFTYKPFVLGSVATVMIIVSNFIAFLWMFLYVGNVLMIIAAVWNIKLNKFTGLPKFR
jgi:uncharacterized membrane protein (DUF485 family)